MLLKKESTCESFSKLYTAYSVLKNYSKGIQSVEVYVYCEYLSTQKIIKLSSAILNELLPWWSPASAKHYNVQCVPYGQRKNIFK